MAKKVLHRLRCVQRHCFAPLLLSLGLLIGCATDPPATPDDDFLPRSVEPSRPVAASDPTADAAPINWISRRLSVGVDRSLSEAWSLSDEAVLPELSRAVWNANGLRVGVLPAVRGRDFVLALGEVTEVRDTQLLSHDYPEPLRRSPPLRAEFFADLTIPPRPVTIETLTRGRLRMLMASRALSGGRTRVTLIPQHHLDRATLLPLPPRERVLEGRVFDELSVQIDLDPQDVLLLGFYQSPLPSQAPEDTPEDTPEPGGATTPDPSAAAAMPNDASDEADTASGIDTPDEPETPAAEEAEPLPPLNLGRGLFTTGIADDDQQMLFLLRPLR